MKNTIFIFLTLMIGLSSNANSWVPDSWELTYYNWKTDLQLRSNEKFENLIKTDDDIENVRVTFDNLVNVYITRADVNEELKRVAKEKLSSYCYEISKKISLNKNITSQQQQFNLKDCILGDINGFPELKLVLNYLDSKEYHQEKIKSCMVQSYQENIKKIKTSSFVTQYIYPKPANWNDIINLCEEYGIFSEGEHLVIADGRLKINTGLPDGYTITKDSTILSLSPISDNDLLAKIITEEDKVSENMMPCYSLDLIFLKNSMSSFDLSKVNNICGSIDEKRSEKQPPTFPGTITTDNGVYSHLSACAARSKYNSDSWLLAGWNYNTIQLAQRLFNRSYTVTNNLDIEPGNIFGWLLYAKKYEENRITSNNPKLSTVNDSFGCIINYFYNMFLYETIKVRMDEYEINSNPSVDLYLYTGHGLQFSLKTRDFISNEIKGYCQIKKEKYYKDSDTIKLTNSMYGTYIYEDGSLFMPPFGNSGRPNKIKIDEVSSDGGIYGLWKNRHYVKPESFMQNYEYYVCK